MTFKISRTSQWVFDKNDPPCKNAVIGVEEYPYTTRAYDENGNRIMQSEIRKKNI